MTYRDGAEERGGPIAPLEVDIGFASDSQFYADLAGTIVGVFASTFLVLPTDTAVELVVSIPDVGSFTARGVVRFVRAAGSDQLPGLGIAFSKIESSDYASSVRFCDRFRAPMFFDEG